MDSGLASASLRRPGMTLGALPRGIHVFWPRVATKISMAGTRSYAGVANVVVPVRCAYHHQPSIGETDGIPLGRHHADHPQ
jgi:hypothetical protein